LEAAELNGDTLATIDSFEKKQVGEEKVEKWVMFFKEFERGLVLNRTNTNRCIGLFGNETDDWIGKQITLYPSETDFAGKTVPCIRVRETAPKTKQDARR
jgi:hypothetical protein